MLTLKKRKNRKTMAEPKTSKSKLDAALGIAPDKSIDDFLNSLTIENNSAKEAVDNIDKSVKEEVENIDKELKALSFGNGFDESQKLLSIVSIDKSLKNIDDLISISKDVIKHIYENIVCTELVDSELIHAAAAFIESCHLNVKEYIDLYKDRLKFYDKVQFEMLQQKHRRELLEAKQKFEREKLDSKSIDITPTGMRTFNQEDIVNALKNQKL